MQIILLHLSDIHIRTGQDVALSRACKIKEACHSAAPNATGCVIVLSGDVAYSGLATQYEAAFVFLEELRAMLGALPSIQSVESVAVPGNHDCDFTSESDIRQYLLQDIQALYDSGLNPSSDRVKAILEVQKNFFTFEARLTRGKEIGFDERLSYVRIVQFGTFSIKFQCYNTAWLSRKNEIQAKLFLPNDAIEPASAEANICVSMFHHPYNWLDSNNYRLLRDAVEQTSDFVFTGHEHVAGGQSVERFSGEHLHYLEAAAFDENASGDSGGFSAVVLDPSSGDQRLEQFRWDGEIYASRLRKSWGAIIKNPARERHLFKLNSTAREHLTNPGAAFTHRRKRNLRLEDFYVYPDLAQWSVQDLAAGKKGNVIRSKEVLDHFRKTPRILITGPDRSGKTSLLKKLFMDLGAEYVPLLVEAKHFEGRISENRFQKTVESMFVQQYAESELDRFLQLDPSRRILLIDDLHQANLSSRNETTLVQLAEHMFGHVVIAAADVYRVRNLAVPTKERDPFDNFQNCDIKEFGHRLRGQLISKWLSLGRDAASELQRLDYETRATEKVITTLLGRKVIPAVPFNILSLLHSMESTQPHAVLDGSYGSFIELLIKANFGLSGESAADDADIKLTYTSVIAYAMFDRERDSLSEVELRKLHEDYRRTFDVSPSFPGILNDLEAARVLERIDGNYGFRYRHVYFYFVAKYFDRSLRRQSPKSVELRSKLAYMADRLHNEEMANILLFYLYLTQDWQLTNYILSNARAIYADRPASDLEADVEFVNRIYKEPPRMLLEDSDVEKHRDKYREAMDEADEQEGSVSLDAKETYSDDLSDLHKANIAFKTLQVLGQVLRSSAASMEGDIKLEITNTCYMLGLRTLRALLGIAENNLEQFRLYLSILIKERAATNDVHISENDLLKRTDEAVIWLTFGCGYGTIKKISYSVGHHHLADTYERLLARNGSSTSVRIIDLAIKLDHSAIVPLPEITQLRDRLIKNTFGYTLLRQLIADFLYLYRIEFRTLQKLGSMFKIEGTTGPAFLLPDQKRD